MSTVRIPEYKYDEVSCVNHLFNNGYTNDLGSRWSVL